MQIIFSPSPHIEPMRDLVPEPRQDAHFSLLLDQAGSSLLSPPGPHDQSRLSAVPRRHSPSDYEQHDHRRAEPSDAEPLDKAPIFALLPQAASPSFDIHQAGGEPPNRATPQAAITTQELARAVTAEPQQAATVAFSAPASPHALIDATAHPAQRSAPSPIPLGGTATTHTAFDFADDALDQRISPVGSAGDTKLRSAADLSLEQSLSQSRPFKPAGQAPRQPTPEPLNGASFSPWIGSTALSPDAIATTSGRDIAGAVIEQRLDEPSWGQSLGARLTGLAQGPGIRTLELNLNPVELGPLSVSLSVDRHSQAILRLEIAHPQTHKVLDDSLDQLREAFNERGLNLTQVQLVDRPAATAQQHNGSAAAFSQPGGGGEFAGQQQAFQQRPGQGAETAPQSGSSEAESEISALDQAAPSSLRPTPRHSTGVDLFA